MAFFCAGTVVFLLVRDLMWPEVRDVEVWLGFELRGRWAQVSAPLHWGLFAFAAWAFYRGRPWIWTPAVAYALVIALSHLIWNLTSERGAGWLAGLLQLGLFSIPALLIHAIRPRGADAGSEESRVR